MFSVIDPSGAGLKIKLRRPRLRERARILERDVEREVLADAMDALDEVEICVCGRPRASSQVESL